MIIDAVIQYVRTGNLGRLMICVLLLLLADLMILMRVDVLIDFYSMMMIFWPCGWSIGWNDDLPVTDIHCAGEETFSILIFNEN